MALFRLNSAKIYSRKILAATLLLTIYCLGSIEFEGIHEALHAKEHTETAEKNPCHRSIYHQDKNACKHTTHVSEVKTCLLCHLIFHSDEWIETPNTTTAFTIQGPTDRTVLPAPISTPRFSKHDRGPPHAA